MTITTGRNLLLAADARRRDALETFRLVGSLSGIASSQADITKSTTRFGSTWRLKTGIRYITSGGVELTASAIVRRGYSLPAAMVQPIGSDVQTFDSRNSSREFGWAATRWDTEVRIRKRLTTSGPVDVSVVGEVLNLLDLNTGGNVTPGASALTSRTVRAGIVLGF